MSQNNISINERGKLIFIFNYGNKRKLSIIMGILWIIVGLFVILGTVFGRGQLEKEGIFHYLFIILGFIMIYIGINGVAIYSFISDLKIFEKGFIYPNAPISYIIRKKEFFIPFNDFKSIEMTIIPIGVKCLRIVTLNKTYEITKKEMKNVEDIYKKLNEAYSSFVSKTKKIIQKERKTKS